MIERLLKKKWSPEQISGHLRKSGSFSVSHETIYRHIWRDRHRGGTLHMHLRWSRKKRRKRYNKRPNDPSSATRPAGGVNCNRSAMAGFACVA